MVTGSGQQELVVMLHPYFRIFNPFTQQKKFDKEFRYVKRWIDNFNEDNYLEYIVDHKEARERALKCYKSALD